MPRESASAPQIGGQSHTRPDARIAALAERQHGVVARAQLIDLGLGTRAIEHRVARGLLRPMHRGVYAAGHRPRTREAAWMAAVLAAGPGAVLSHRAAAAFWRMRDTSRAAIEVTTPRGCRRPGIQAHRTVPASDEVMVARGVPVTTPARTLFDLAAVVSAAQLEHAFNEAEVRRLTSPVSVEALLERYPARRGAAALARVLAKHGAIGETFTRSRLERRFLELVDAHGLPRPEMNRHTDGGELDATWRAQRLIVELDGYASHGTREADRARDRALQVAGWRVVRVTWRQLVDDAGAIAAQLAALLDAPAYRAGAPPRAYSTLSRAHSSAAAPA